MSRRLMSRKAVVRWLRRGGQPTSATLRERLLIARLKPLSPDAANELDEICSEHIMDGENRTLFVVGTLLVRRGHCRLWRRVYRACQVGPSPRGDELRFLERMTLEARQRAL